MNEMWKHKGWVLDEFGEYIRLADDLLETLPDGVFGRMLTVKDEEKTMDFKQCVEAYRVIKLSVDSAMVKAGIEGNESLEKRLGLISENMRHDLNLFMKTELDFFADVRSTIYGMECDQRAHECFVEVSGFIDEIVALLRSTNIDHDGSQENER